MSGNKLTMASLFDGSGGFPLASALAGIEPIWASEIAPFPVRVTTKRFPNMKHYGDVSKINGAKVPPVDIITFGSPCFPAGTLVLTNEGYTDIEAIEVGDKVLTHTGKWQTVTDIGSKLGETVLVKGNHYGLECTPNHPIYCKQDDGTVEWIPAENVAGLRWATPNKSAFCPMPIPTNTARQTAFPKITRDLFYFIGRWLGDGWVRDSQRSGRPEGQHWATIYICDSVSKENELKEMVKKIAPRYSVEYCRSIVKVKFQGQVFCRWLTENFGKGASNKKLPAWVFSLDNEYREALLKGIFDSDGYEMRDNHWKISTVSKKLAYGIRLLGETQGFSTTIFKTNVPAKGCVEGRIVNQKDYYTVALTKAKQRRNEIDEIHSWYQVRSVKATGEVKRVYNLTVENDNSYIADGIIVHNCQDLSLAGRRAGIEGEKSGLFYEAVRVINEMRLAYGKPRYIVWENVYGAFSSNGGEDFRLVLDEIARIKRPSFVTPRCEKWENSGEILADDFSIAWRGLDAQYWGVPQRRKRVFLVADFDGRGASKILFESEGVSGYSASRFRAWQRDTQSAEGRTGEASISYDGYNGSVDDKASTLGVNCGFSSGQKRRNDPRDGNRKPSDGQPSEAFGEGADP